MNYYQLLPQESEIPEIGVAYAPEETDTFAHPKDQLDITFILRDGPFADLIMSDIGWRLFSRKASKIIHSHASSDDSVQWHDVQVADLNETRAYSAIWFKYPADVLDTENTMYAPGTDFIVKPCFHSHRVSKYNVFTFEPTLSAAPIYIAESIQNDLLDSLCTGMSFTKVRIND